MPDMDEMAPASALDAHLSRAGAGQVLEAVRDHLRLPPAARRAETAMRGKVPRDVTRAVATPRARKAVADAGRCWSPTDLWGKSSSPVCLGNGPALVPGTPNRQCRQRLGGWGSRFPRRWTSHPTGGTSWDSGHSATFGSILGPGPFPGAAYAKRKPRLVRTANGSGAQVR